MRVVLFAALAPAAPKGAPTLVASLHRCRGRAVAQWSEFSTLLAVVLPRVLTPIASRLRYRCCLMSRTEVREEARSQFAFERAFERSSVLAASRAAQVAEDSHP